MSFSDWLADRIFLPFNNQQVDCSCRIWLKNTKPNEKVSATSKLVRSAKSIQIIPCRCPPRPKVIMVYTPANITGDNWRAPSCPTSGPVFPTLSIVMMNEFVPNLSAASRWKWDANKRDRSHCYFQIVDIYIYIIYIYIINNIDWYIDIVDISTLLMISMI